MSMARPLTISAKKLSAWTQWVPRTKAECRGASRTPEFWIASSGRGLRHCCTCGPAVLVASATAALLLRHSGSAAARRRHRCRGLVLLLAVQLPHVHALVEIAEQVLGE